MTDRLIAALDVGGTKIVGALFAPDGESGQMPKIIHRVRVATPGPSGAADPGLLATVEMARSLAKEGAALGTPVGAVGAGFPEYVQDHRLTSAEVLAWSTQPIEHLASCFTPGTPVVVDSDVRLGALAEARWGVGVGLGSFLYLSWGTGLSSTLVIDGTCWTGAHGAAIAVGELPVPNALSAGWEGNLEAFASGAGIAARYRSATGAATEDGARTVLQRQAEGDVVAAEILKSAGQALAATIAGICHVLDPEAVVLGGGLGSADTVLHDHVHSLASELVPLGTPPRWLVAGLGADAGLIGAATCALDAQ